MENKEKKKQKKKISQSAIVLIISAIIIAIPVIVFLVILLSASLNNATPQNGDRYKYDLNPSISNSSISTLENKIKGISGVEDCEITLKTSQLRVNVDMADSMTKSQAEDITNQAFSIVNSELPISTYFTISNTGEKMYDLSINVYNYLDNSSGTMIYYCLTKNSKMDSYDIQLLSEPKDPDLAEELRNPQISVNQEESGQDEQ